MKAFFNNETYEMPSSFNGIIINRILTEVEDPERTLFIVKNSQKDISIMFGKKVKDLTV